ncbi:hypothetical protein, partial [Nocardiopsis sp. RV163]|uniref:hypothetical protein n=1 Tax=Nocardiopsis sp. RV163 TaxID=1661388 RepID=UPI00064BAF4D
MTPTRLAAAAALAVLVASGCGAPRDTAPGEGRPLHPTALFQFFAEMVARKRASLDEHDDFTTALPGPRPGQRLPQRHRG